MAGFRIIKSDFPPGTTGMFILGQVKLAWYEGWKTASFNLTKSNVERIEVITEENQKHLLGTLGLGLAGGLLLGPLGLLAGVLAGGRRKEVCFIIWLKDGRKILAAADTKAFQQIMTLTL